ARQSHHFVIPGPLAARSPESMFADLWLWIPDSRGPSPPAGHFGPDPLAASGMARGGEGGSNKLQGDAAQRAEIGVQGVALLGVHHAGERAGENQMAGLERHAVGAELVGKPGDAERRMAEHAGGDAGLLDLGVAVHDAADPAQIDVHRPDRPAADDDAGGGAVVRHSVEYLAWILQPCIDDL